MAQPPEAAVDAPRSLSMSDAAAAFDDLDALENEAAPEDPDAAQFEDDEPEGELDEGEEPDVDEPEDSDEGGEPETPAIDPPASLTAEEKAAWAQLPPEAQLMLKSVEARRTTETQRGLEKAREAQREAEAAAAERVAEAQRLFAEQQTQLASDYAPIKPDPRQFPDWQTYSAAQAQYEARAAQHSQRLQQLQGLHDEATREQERLHGEAMRRMVAEVRDEVPEFTNGQFQELMDKLTPLALELGYPENLLAEASPVDIRAIKRAAAWKVESDKYKALMARQMTKVRSGKTAKPNAAQPLGSGKARANDRALSAFRSNPSSMSAAAAVFEDI